MEVVTKVGQLDEYLGKTLKPSEIITYGESIEELIENRYVFFRGEDAFVALRSMNLSHERLHCYRLQEFITQPIPPKGLGVREFIKKPEEVFDFMKQGGNFMAVIAANL